VFVNGYDGTLHEMYFAHGPAAIQRGYHCLLFDGPGQGRNLFRDGISMRPDWENVVRPVIGYVLTRPEVDPRKIILCGWSFGGFLAPRAAAFEKRIAALIADPGQWDQRDGLQTIPLAPEVLADLDAAGPAPFEPIEQGLRSPQADPFLHWKIIQRGLWVHGVDTLYDLAREMVRYRVSPVANQIHCPTLLTASEGDAISKGSKTLYDALLCPKVMVPFTLAEGAGGHCETTARRLYHQRVFDWLDETLAAKSGN
jgi:pimeloyl-ACP methyl ester carboxylesterase